MNKEDEKLLTWWADVLRHLKSFCIVIGIIWRVIRVPLFWVVIILLELGILEKAHILRGI